MAVERCHLPSFDLCRKAPCRAGTSDYRLLALGEVFRGDAKIDKGAVRYVARSCESLRAGAGDKDWATPLYPW